MPITSFRIDGLKRKTIQKPAVRCKRCRAKFATSVSVVSQLKLPETDMQIYAQVWRHHNVLSSSKLPVATDGSTWVLAQFCPSNLVALVLMTPDWKLSNNEIDISTYGLWTDTTIFCECCIKACLFCKRSCIKRSAKQGFNQYYRFHWTAGGKGRNRNCAHFSWRVVQKSRLFPSLATQLTNEQRPQLASLLVNQSKLPFPDFAKELTKYESSNT